MPKTLQPIDLLSDDAKRLRDEYNMHRQAAPHDSIGKWLKVPLAIDGDFDHVLYDSRLDAVVACKNSERRFCFVQIVPRTMTGFDAETFLRIQRRLADANMQMADPEQTGGGKEVITRSTREDQMNSIKGILGLGQPSNISFRR